MNKPTCAVPECPKDSYLRTYCNAHYLRLQRTGSPTGSLRKTAAQRFWSKVDKSGDCWTWTAHVMPLGYGLFTRTGGGHVLAHRFAHELEHGPIPAGMEVDHRCFNRACVNPDHLRLATHKQNNEHRKGAHRNSKSGIRGVYWREDCQKWEVKVGHHGKSNHIGLFTSAAEAEAVAIATRKQLFTHNDVDRRPA